MGFVFPWMPAMKYFVFLLSLLLSAVACQSRPTEQIRHADHVDLPRFMGDWYVIASIPTVFERHAHNAVERYELRDDGRIDTTFTFRRGGFDGPERRMTPVATVRDHPSNALWGMQFVWPFRADFRVLYLAGDYSHTIIGRQKRDYVWIMAREPEIAGDDYRAMLAFLEREGYDIAAIERVPQCWQPSCAANRH